LLRVVEGVLVDDRGVDDLLRPDPCLRAVPPHLGGVTESHVVDVEENLVLALPVPHLVAGVAGVGEDRPDRALRPSDAAPVPVSGPVVRGRASDAVTGQPLGDREQPAPAEELSEDPLDNGRGLIV
jgi:hypothetical protein